MRKGRDKPPGHLGQGLWTMGRRLCDAVGMILDNLPSVVGPIGANRRFQEV